MSSKGYRIPQKKKELKRLANSYCKKMGECETKEEKYWSRMYCRVAKVEQQMKFLKPGEKDSTYYTKEEILEKTPNMCIPSDNVIPVLLGWTLNKIPKQVVDYLEEYCLFLILEEDVLGKYIIRRKEDLIVLSGKIRDRQPWEILETTLHECAHCYLAHNYSPSSRESHEEEAWSLVDKWLTKFNERKEVK